MVLSGLMARLFHLVLFRQTARSTCMVLYLHVTRCISLVLSQVLTRSLRLALFDWLDSLSYRGSLLGPGSFPYNGSLGKNWLANFYWVLSENMARLKIMVLSYSMARY
jgi:hypothetical protein